jgi:hypothetical protein
MLYFPVVLTTKCWTSLLIVLLLHIDDDEPHQQPFISLFFIKIIMGQAIIIKTI